MTMSQSWYYCFNMLSQLNVFLRPIALFSVKAWTVASLHEQHLSHRFIKNTARATCHTTRHPMNTTACTSLLNKSAVGFHTMFANIQALQFLFGRHSDTKTCFEC